MNAMNEQRVHMTLRIKRAVYAEIEKRRKREKKSRTMMVEQLLSEALACGTEKHSRGGEIETRAGAEKPQSESLSVVIPFCSTEKSSYSSEMWENLADEIGCDAATSIENLCGTKNMSNSMEVPRAASIDAARGDHLGCVTGRNTECVTKKAGKNVDVVVKVARLRACHARRDTPQLERTCRLAYEQFLCLLFQEARRFPDAGASGVETVTDIIAWKMWAGETLQLWTTEGLIRKSEILNNEVSVKEWLKFCVDAGLAERKKVQRNGIPEYWIVFTPTL